MDHTPEAPSFLPSFAANRGRNLDKVFTVDIYDHPNGQHPGSELVLGKFLCEDGDPELKWADEVPGIYGWQFYRTEPGTRHYARRSPSIVDSGSVFLAFPLGD